MNMPVLTVGYMVLSSPTPTPTRLGMRLLDNAELSSCLLSSYTYIVNLW